MNSGSKPKLTNKPKNTLKRDKKFQNGRWTEKEHYLFLLAVKEFGKDWKKIEGIVKTRSSTQSRSHAQKVLKDDLMDNLDQEISRLAKIYENIPAPEEKPAPQGERTEGTKTLPSGAKGRRKAKRAYKEAIKKRENEKVIQLSSMSSENYDEESKEGNLQDEASEASDYSYPDDFKTKLFEIVKVKSRMKTSKRRRRATRKNDVAKLSRELVNTRKDSAITAASASQASILSPAKTAASDSLTPSLRARRGDGQFRITPFRQNGGVSSNKNGRPGDAKGRSQNGMVAPKINHGLRRATSLQVNS